jgi:hypothetical protein
MSRTNISNLPLELVVHAMGLLSTPQDLCALINTSKFYHHAFQYSRTTILVDVIPNAMPYESIHYAAAACRAGEIAKSWWVNSPGAYFVEARTEFLENYRQGRQPGDTFLKMTIYCCPCIDFGGFENISSCASYAGPSTSRVRRCLQ